MCVRGTYSYQFAFAMKSTSIIFFLHFNQTNLKSHGTKLRKIGLVLVQKRRLRETRNDTACTKTQKGYRHKYASIGELVSLGMENGVVCFGRPDAAHSSVAVSIQPVKV